MLIASVWRTLCAGGPLSVAQYLSTGAESGPRAYAFRIVCLLVACFVMPVPANAVIPTSVSITSSADTVAPGESFQLTISVNAPAARDVPSGTITLYDGATQLGVFNILLDANSTVAQVQLTTTPQLAGPYTFAFSAIYSGDGSFASGTSPILNVEVTQSTSYSSADIIQAMWLGQKVISDSAGTTSGYTGYSSSSIVSYSNQTSPFGWSVCFICVDVALAATPSTVAEGNDVLLHASVIDAGGFSSPTFALVRPGDPSGTVTFREGTTILGTADLSSVTDSAGKVTSQASLSLSTLSPGEHRITADYSGDRTYEPGSSPELPVTVYAQAVAPPAVSTPLVPPVVSFSGPTATGSGMSKVEFSGGGAECTFSKSAYLPAPNNANSTVDALTDPAQLSFPDGLVDFTASGCVGGSTLNFTLTLPSAAPAGATLYKYGPTFSDTTPHWYSFPASFNGKTVTFSVTDGGLGDDDLSANGVIADPSGVAVPGVTAGDTSSPTPSSASANPPSSGGGSVDPLSLGMLLIISLLARMHIHRACVRPKRPLTWGRRRAHGLRGHHPGAYVTIRSCIQL